ncbi:MAG: TRAP transporter small permease [Proteobacteria bacterium]|nr:TRAP transporter small permease [Pseudomonadota bacterium]
MTLQRSMIVVERLILVCAGTITALMIVHVTTDVIAKNLFNRPLPGTITIVSNFYMPIITFLPLILVQHYDQHVSVDVLFDRLPAGMRRFLTGLAYLLATVAFGLMAYYGWLEAMSKFRIRAFISEYGIRFPIWPGYYLPAVGYALIAAYTLLQFLNSVLRLFRNTSSTS